MTITTWANCWNGVNHPATAPTAEEDAVLPEWPSDFDGVDHALAIAQTESIFRSPPPQFQPPGGWDLRSRDKSGCMPESNAPDTREAIIAAVADIQARLRRLEMERHTPQPSFPPWTPPMGGDCTSTWGSI